MRLALAAASLRLQLDVPAPVCAQEETAAVVLALKNDTAKKQ